MAKEQEDKKNLREKANNLIHTEKLENAALRDKVHEKEQELIDLTKKIVIETAQKRKLQESLDLISSSKLSDQDSNSEALKALKQELANARDSIQRELIEKEDIKAKYNAIEDRLNAAVEREHLQMREAERLKGLVFFFKFLKIKLTKKEIVF